jgi:hypothetical protein
MARSAKSNIHERAAAFVRGRRRRHGRTDVTLREESGSGTATSKGPTFPAGIQTIGSFITWLAGAVGGILAIFYAFGYVASTSYVYMLGVDLVDLHYDYLVYVLRGAHFFIAIFDEPRVIWLLTVSSVLAILFIFAGLRRLCRRFAITPPFRRFAWLRPDWQGIAYLCLVLLLAYRVDYLTDSEAMNVSGLLLSATHGQPTAGSIRDWILSGDRQELRNQFTTRVVNEGLFGAMLFLAWWVSRGRRWPVLRTAPFAVVLLTATVYLAGDYGRLELPVKFKEATIPDDHPMAKLYQLNRTADGYYVFWDCRQRRVRWIPIGSERVIVFGNEERTLRQILQSCEGTTP